MDAVTWQTVALAVVNMLQLVLLAYINRRQGQTIQKLNGHLEAHMRNG